MESSIFSYRSKTNLSYAACVLFAFLTSWMLGVSNFFDIPFLKSRGFSMFVIFLILPAFIYLLYLISRNDPVVEVDNTMIRLRGVLFPWRQLSIQYDEFESMSTNHEPDTVPCDLCFAIVSDHYWRLRASPIWRTKDDKQHVLYFDVANTTTSPEQVVKVINTLKFEHNNLHRTMAEN